MEKIGERVHDGHGTLAHEGFQQRVLAAADDDAVQVARKHFRRVLRRFAARKLHVFRVEHHGIAAELADADLKRNARARRFFEKEQPPRLSRERRGSAGVPAPGFERGGEFEDFRRFRDAQIGLF